MTQWIETPFDSILLESKDGEWGVAKETIGYKLCHVIRGTDFDKINNSTLELPKRWIKDHIVERKKLFPGDILLEAAGGTAKQSTGRSCLLTDKFFQLHSDLPVMCASFSRFLRLRTDQHNPAFVYYYLQALYHIGYMAVFNIQHTGVSRFQYTTFKKHTILKFPGLPIQDKIAAILSAYNDLIENNQRRITLLEKMAEEIYREWFVRFRFPGHETVSFVKGIPEGWSFTKLEKAFDFTGGGTPSKVVFRYWDDGKINWFTPSDITSSEGIFLMNSGTQCSEEGLANSSARLFPAYSVMLTSRATIGAIGINLTPACTNQGFITCIPNIRYPLTFLYHWLKLSKSHFDILASGSTFAELTKGTFKQIKILTPPKATVSKFEQVVSPLFKQIENLLVKNNNLTETRNLLLPRLISGKLSVENLGIHFPPSMQAEEETETREAAHA